MKKLTFVIVIALFVALFSTTGCGSSAGQTPTTNTPKNEPEFFTDTVKRYYIATGKEDIRDLAQDSLGDRGKWEYIVLQNPGVFPKGVSGIRKIYVQPKKEVALPVFASKKDSTGYLADASYLEIKQIVDTTKNAYLARIPAGKKGDKLFLGTRTVEVQNPNYNKPIFTPAPAPTTAANTNTISEAGVGMPGWAILLLAICLLLLIGLAIVVYNISQRTARNEGVLGEQRTGLTNAGTRMNNQDGRIENAVNQSNEAMRIANSAANISSRNTLALEELESTVKKHKAAADTKFGEHDELLAQLNEALNRPTS